MATTLFWTLGLLIAYHILGYPAVLWTLNAIRRRRSERIVRSADGPRSVSIVIPAHNEAGVIAQTLAACRRLTELPEPVQLIVVDDGSEDGTPEQVERWAWPEVELVRVRPRQGKPHALNEGVRRATGELVVFLDANVLPRPNAVARLLAAFADPSVGAASAIVHLAHEGTEVEAGERVYHRFESWVQRMETALGSAIGVDGAMYAFRRELYRPLPKDTILDDFVNSIRILRTGKRIVFVPDAIATEVGTATLVDEWKRKKRLAAGSFQALVRASVPPWQRPVLLWQFASHKLLRWLLPWLLIGFAICGFAGWSAAWWYGACAAFVVGAVLAGAAAAVVRPLRRVPLFGALAYAVVSLAAFALGPVLAATHSVLWEKATRASAARSSEPCPEEDAVVGADRAT